MKQRLLELITNDTGELSRTQIGLWIALALAISLTITDVVRGGVLTWQVLVVLGGLHLFALADRVQAKFVSFHIGRDGADISLGTDVLPIAAKPETAVVEQ
jgi:hypothetical protein